MRLSPHWSATWLLMLLTLSAVAAEQAPQAELERNRIVQGESVNLTLRVPGDLHGEPDLTVLQADFDILGRSQSSHTSIVNGRMSSERRWQLSLAPKRSGTLSVPAIPVGDQASQALSLQVLEAGSPAAAQENPAVFMEVDIQPDAAYVQQQLDYRVRIFHREPLQEAGLDPPRASGALIESLGDDRSYREYRNGQRYSVIERHYAIFPQQSGPLRIDGPTLAASVVVPAQRRGSRPQQLFGRDPFGGFPDLGGFFNETRPLRIRAKPLELQIRPRADTGQGTWLPAESLTIEESWSEDPPRLRVGEPLTRTLTLRARGLTESQLPDLSLPEVATLKAYPDQPQGEHKTLDGVIESSKQLKVALVPTRPGRIELPEVRVDWWDTQADRPRYSIVPARSFEVLPAPAGTPAPAPQSAPTAAIDSAPEAAAGGTPSGPQPLSAGYWPWISAGLGLLWLITLLLWWRFPRRPSADPSIAATPARAAQTASITDIRRACKANDPAIARRALLLWAAARWPNRPPRGLDALSQRLADDAARMALRELDQALYAKAGTDWNGKRAWSRLAPWLKSAGRTPSEDAPGSAALPALYPRPG